MLVFVPYPLLARRRAEGRVASRLSDSAPGSSSRCATVDRANLSAQAL